MPEQTKKLSKEQEKLMKLKRKKELKLKRDKMQKMEKRALMLSLIAGMAFALVEFIFAIYTHSQSVLMDAVYDTSELIFIVLILYLTPLFYKPISEDHPYGYFQLESIFLIIKGFMMLSVTFGVSADVIRSALSGGNPVDESLISLFQLILGLVSVVIYLIMKRMNRDLSSPTVDTEILEWRLDIFYSIGLSTAFFASSFLSRTSLAFLAPYVDPMVAVAVMVMMLPENVKMLWGALRDIFLFAPDEETVENVKQVCLDQMAEEKITPVYVDVTRTGRQMWVAVYFDTESASLSVKGLRRVTEEVTRELQKSYENCVCELLLLPKKEEPAAALTTKPAKRLIILGAGGFGHTVADIARQTGAFRDVRFLDDHSREPGVLGLCSTFAEYADADTVFYPAFGNNELRLGWLDRLETAGCQIATIIHPTVYCSPSAVLEPGVAVLPGAMINTACRIGRGALINMGVLIDHGCILEEGTHICVGAIIKAENRIPACMKVEAGVIIENRTYPL